ncbi:mitochondrial ATPase expression-domain-containing protein [Lineolata rhizophorae]|uniref:Mitochondrial ATPase expression-domain-containing protein n=1 Tax=Lineolata rhizophorae TaxID=578093 RepID=A0A6A6PDS7_9PEZI|nr:mitochondrial ATPase expression-domain-containing protein [Lineolata rhizophorae]
MNTFSTRLAPGGSRLASASWQQPRRHFRTPGWICASCRAQGALETGTKQSQQRHPQRLQEHRKLYPPLLKQQRRPFVTTIDNWEVNGESTGDESILEKRRRHAVDDKPECGHSERQEDMETQGMQTENMSKEELVYGRAGDEDLFNLVPPGGSRSSTAGPSATPQETATEVELALRRNDPGLLIRAIVASPYNTDYIQAVPKATFTQMLRLLDSDKIITGYTEVYKHLSLSDAANIRVYPFVDILGDYREVVQHLVRVRMSGGHQLSLLDYKQVLKGAAAVGDLSFAQRLWDMMREFGIEWDLDCFHYMMTAAVMERADHYGPSQPCQQETRVTRFNLEQRMKQERGKEYRGYGVGQNGLKEMITDVLWTLIRDGHSPTEETYSLVMRAYAREGDIEGLKSILMRTWNIDIDAIADMADINSKPTIHRFQSSDPLYPTEVLLCAIAESLGMNNMVATALRVVDHISKTYRITPSTAVWEVLVHWTAIASSRKRGWLADYNDERGRQLPATTVERMMEILQAVPYNVKPTLNMYRLLSEAYLDYANFVGMRTVINQLSKRMFHAQYRCKITTKRLLRARSLDAACTPNTLSFGTWADEGIISATGDENHRAGNISFDALKRVHEDAHLDKVRHNMTLRQLAMEYLQQSGHPLAWWGRRFEREIPDFIKERRHILPSTVRYQTPAGVVQLHIRGAAERQYMYRARSSRKGSLAARNNAQLLRERDELLDWDEAMEKHNAEVRQRKFWDYIWFYRFAGPEEPPVERDMFDSKYDVPLFIKNRRGPKYPLPAWTLGRQICEWPDEGAATSVFRVRRSAQDHP